MLRCASLLAVLLALAGPLGGCTKTDPLYCDEKNPCTDPERPFCDLDGDYPASEGIGRTCIADPEPEPDAGRDPDGGPDGGGGPDASFCTAGEFVQCTDGDTAIYCNEQGSEYVSVDCNSDCSPEQAGCYCEPESSICSSDQTIHCGGNGQVEEIEACALGCNDTGERCVDVNPSNGLAGFLDMTDDAPVVVLSNGASIDTDNGTIQDGDGALLDVPTFQISPPAGGIPILVLAVKSLVAGDTTIIGGRALAIVSDGDILIGGHVRILAGATEEGSCLGGLAGSDGCAGFLCAVVSGGGGGGFATAGGDGGNASLGELFAAGGNGGATRGTSSLVPLLGGCRGGGLSATQGGDGGGAIQLVSRTLIRVEDGTGEAHLNAGGKGAENGFGAGSGGAILLEAPRVVVSSGTSIVANGGGGGANGCGTDAEDGTLDTYAARGAGIGCEDPKFGSGGDGGARSRPSAEDGSDVTQKSPPASFSFGGGGGGGIGRIRVNVPVPSDFVAASNAHSPSASVGSLATR